jgi:DNA-binding transcriptional LysR family regulator
MTRIDPVSLRLFLAVIDSGTIAAAAEREHIAPSAVSKRLSDLEDSLKTPLLQRSNRGIEPTAAGLALVSMARSVLNDLDNIHAQLFDFTSGARGLVRVFANISAITQFLPASLRSFMASYPQIQLQLQEKISSAVQQGVASNAADVGLYAHGNSNADGVISLPYRRDELVVAVPLGHELAERSSVGIQEALAYDYVGLHTGSYINQELLKAARNYDLPFKCRMQVTSFDALTLMVEAGMGIALIPRLIGERYGQLLGIRTLTLDEAWAHRELRICVRSMENLPVAARVFVEHLRANAS